MNETGIKVPGTFDPSAGVPNGSPQRSSGESAAARMTCVFEMDVRSYRGNPFNEQTPFGSPVAVALSDVFGECERLIGINDALVNVLGVIEAILSNAEPHGSEAYQAALEQARAVLDYATESRGRA